MHNKLSDTKIHTRPLYAENGRFRPSSGAYGLLEEQQQYFDSGYKPLEPLARTCKFKGGVVSYGKTPASMLRFSGDIEIR